MMFWFWVPLVMLVVLQSKIKAVGLGVVGGWLVLGVGPRHSRQRAWWVMLLVG